MAAKTAGIDTKQNLSPYVLYKHCLFVSCETHVVDGRWLLIGGGECDDRQVDNIDRAVHVERHCVGLRAAVDVDRDVPAERERRRRTIDVWLQL